MIETCHRNATANVGNSTRGAHDDNWHTSGQNWTHAVLVRFHKQRSFVDDALGEGSVSATFAVCQAEAVRWLILKGECRDVVNDIELNYNE